MAYRPFQKVLCANRGEIAIRVFRACAELGIRTVAVFSNEDATGAHRYKSDEAYLIGQGRDPVGAYLDIESIFEVAQAAGVDAIHPGYGFLSENPTFARLCREQGMEFIGPGASAIQLLGDKVEARALAESQKVPVVPGITLDLEDAEALERAREFHAQHAPVLVKAAHGGGGRGMRVVPPGADLKEAIEQASSEARAAFGSPMVFLEKYLDRVRHIEVQILGDRHGHVVHLGERDCSVQRRHQKVIEVAPAPSLDPGVRDRLCRDAIRLARAVEYHNAGTVEFLVHGDQHYFIEVNPRLQVEHTVTEQVAGVDLVRAQIMVEQGMPLSALEMGLHTADEWRPRGFSIQCRITTEDPANNFLPDTGTIAAYRPPGGLGVRLDGGDNFAGTKVAGHYDSLLVKLVASGPNLERAAQVAARALDEFRIRGVKTNLPFLRNVVRHPRFLAGDTWTTFIEDSPELFDLPESRDRASRLLSYLAEVVVNGHPTVLAEQRLPSQQFRRPRVPKSREQTPPSGTAQILLEKGPEGLADWVRAQHRPLFTDTTMRDAHQSLLATRLRTRDMLAIADATAERLANFFSLETWGGATFDVAYRYLNEDPWQRLRKLKQAIPNVMHQMLLRGANAVGYTSYPDNLVAAFIGEAAEAGIDVFRIFDSLNDLENMRFAIDRVRDTGKVAEVCICYTGDVSNPKRARYTVDYYTDLATQIEAAGAHILAIKDMAGLLRPEAARDLVTALKNTTNLPLHLHTHDTSGNGIATLLAAIEVGVDIVDVAFAPMSGLTSQPSMNALIAALRGSPRESGFANKDLQPVADYWEDVREYYGPFECGLKSGTSEVYYHEIPGGQYSNLRPQVASLGMLDRWGEVKHAYAVVNQLVGDIPKVTPSSKMVGDFAIFLVQNDLLEMREDLEASVLATKDRLLDAAPRLDFPLGVVQYFQGALGHPPGGYPEDLRTAVLKGLEHIDVRPGSVMEPLDLDAAHAALERRLGRVPTRAEVVSHALYPRVLEDHFDFHRRFGDVSILETPVYFHGMEPGQEIWVTIQEGKTLVILLETVGDLQADGTRKVYFRLNGQGREIAVRDRNVAETEDSLRLADAGQPGQVGSPMPGKVVALHCEEGAAVEEGDPLLTLEAMKMETVVRAPMSGQVREVFVDMGDSVVAQQLLTVLDS